MTKNAANKVRREQKKANRGSLNKELERAQDDREQYDKNASQEAARKRRGGKDRTGRNNNAKVARSE